MDVTVCICSYNNSALLARTLSSLVSCQIPEGLSWEIVLVNNNCSDNTDEIAADFKTRLPINYIHEPTPGKSHALNKGLSVASGELIIFADDDIKVCKNWVRAYWETYRSNRDPRYFGGRIQSEHTGYEPDAELLKVAMASIKGVDFGPNPRETTAEETFIGLNWACPLEAIKNLGGFDTSLGLVPGSRIVLVSEETHVMKLLRDAGFKPFYVPEAHVFHNVPAHKCTIKHVLERSFAWGYFIIHTASPHSPKRRILGIPSWAIRKLLDHLRHVLWARVRLRKAYQERILLAQHLGRIAAYRDEYYRR